MTIERFDYDEAAADADELMQEFGRSIVLKRALPGSTEPPYSKFNPGPPVWAMYLVTAAALPASKGTIEAFDNRLEGGSLIDERLRYVLMSTVMKRTSEEGPAAIEPRSTDVLVFDGSDWTVLGCTPLNPAGKPVLYPMGVRRA